MKGRTAVKRFLSITLLILAMLSGTVLDRTVKLVRAQMLEAVMAGPGISATSGTYTYVTWTYVADTGTTTHTSITSPAITLTAGDFIFMHCRAAGGTSYAFSSSPANTFTSLTFLSNPTSATVSEAAYVLSAGSGSTTFTCTPSSTQQYQSMVVLQYHHSGNAATFMTGTDVSSVSKCGSVSVNPCISNPYNVLQGGLVIYCATVNELTYHFTPNSIGPGTPAIRGQSASTLTSAADSGCADNQQPSSNSSQVSNMGVTGGSGATLWNITGAAFY